MTQTSLSKFVKDYVEQGLISFEADPADSDYQEGYRACLKDLDFEIRRKEAEHIKEVVSVSDPDQMPLGL